MSSNAYAAALRLELGPSRQRRWWRWLTHGAVVATVPLLQSFWPAVMVFIAVLVSWQRSRAEPQITLLWHSDGSWSLFEQGVETEATLAEAPFVQPWLVILPLRTAQRRRVRRVLILADMLPAHEFRRLRVRLRTGGGTP